MSTPPDTAKSDLYLELGVEPRSTAAEIIARIEEERERSNLLKKIPKRRSEAVSKLLQLAEIERVLLNPSMRAAYDARSKGGEPSPSTGLATERLLTSAPATTPKSEKVKFCPSCGAALPEGASFCEACIPDRVVLPPVGGTTGLAEKAVKSGASYSAPTELRGPIPFIYMVSMLFLAVLALIWFLNRKPELPVAVSPGPGQAMDLRTPGNAELKSPTVSRRSSEPSRSGPDDLETTVRRDSKAARKLNAQGLQALAKPQPDLIEAKRLFQEAVEFDPEYVEALNNLGDVCGILEDYKTAEAILSKVLTMAPKRRVAHGNMGYVEAKLGNIDQAEFHFCEYIRAFKSFDRGTSKLKGSFTDPDPQVQTAVNLTIASCKP